MGHVGSQNHTTAASSQMQPMPLCSGAWKARGNKEEKERRCKKGSENFSWIPTLVLLLFFPKHKPHLQQYNNEVIAGLQSHLLKLCEKHVCKWWCCKTELVNNLFKVILLP